MILRMVILVARIDVPYEPTEEFLGLIHIPRHPLQEANPSRIRKSELFGCDPTQCGHTGEMQALPFNSIKPVYCK